jgi:hypothetical protein
MYMIRVFWRLMVVCPSRLGANFQDAQSAQANHRDGRNSASTPAGVVRLIAAIFESILAIRFRKSGLSSGDMLSLFARWARIRASRTTSAILSSFASGAACANKIRSFSSLPLRIRIFFLKLGTKRATP